MAGFAPVLRAEREYLKPPTIPPPRPVGTYIENVYQPTHGSDDTTSGGYDSTTAGTAGDGGEYRDPPNAGGVRDVPTERMNEQERGAAFAALFSAQSPDRLEQLRGRVSENHKDSVKEIFVAFNDSKISNLATSVNELAKLETQLFQKIFDLKQRLQKSKSVSRSDVIAIEMEKDVGDLREKVALQATKCGVLEKEFLQTLKEGPLTQAYQALLDQHRSSSLLEGVDTSKADSHN